MCDHPNGSCLAVLFCVQVMMPYKMASHTVVFRGFALGGGKYNFPNNDWLGGYRQGSSNWRVCG